MITAHDRPRRTVLRGARLFDGERFWPDHDPMVLIDGAVITAVDAGERPPGDAEIIDLPGTTLMPGLIDTHVHLAFDTTADPVGTLAARDDDQAVAAMIEAGRATLAGGVTTVRDLGDRDFLSLSLRGRPDLPTIVAAGPPITTHQGHCHYLGGSIDSTLEGMRAAVRERAQRGCDVVKVMASGGTLTPGTRQEEPQFLAEALAVAVDEAHRLGLPITAHAHATQAIADAVAAGVDSLEHVTFWSAEGIDDRPDLMQQIVDAGIVVSATVGMLQIPGFSPPPPVAARIPVVIANFRRMHDLGATIVAGTDAGIGPSKPHDILRTGVGQLAEVGMPPLEALRAVTSVAARVLRLADTKGRLAPGFDADILVVDGDPATDPDAIHRIRAVYARGRQVPAAQR